MNETPVEKPIIDPLRRVFIPVEKRTSRGTIVFKTTDGRLYARVDEGMPMCRATPKIRGKKARALDKLARRKGKA